jgi:hypothetical protein
MKKPTSIGCLILMTLLSTSIYAQGKCANGSDCTNSKSPENMLGWFDLSKDLFLPQFDSKTDVDDIHSIAAVGTMLMDPRFSRVNFHAVAGAYGIQEGEYVPANELFHMAFGSQWSDAHNTFETALSRVTGLVMETLGNGGDIWIAEAGQSDFSAALVRQVKLKLPAIDTRQRVHVVQHSEWNQESTNPADLEYVKNNTDYNKIEDGNATGNGTPGFKTDSGVAWTRATGNAKTGGYWRTARNIADKYNGESGRYLNEDIKAGGMDFSDVSETCWIFGFSNLSDVNEFFDEFGAVDNK